MIILILYQTIYVKLGYILGDYPKWTTRILNNKNHFMWSHC